MQRFSAPPPQAKVQQAGGERGLLSDVAAMVQRFSAAAPPPPLATNAPSPRTGSAPAEAPLRIKRPARVLNGDDLQDGEQHKQMATRGFTRATPLEAPAAAGLLPEVAAMVQRFSAAKIPEAAATPDVDIKAEYGDDGYIECINDQLGDMQAEATFSTAQHVATPLPLPGLKVAGVGYVGLPLCDAQAQQLRSLDAQAPRAITVSAKWNAVVQGFVETTRAPLGVLCGARAELRGLSVTGAGEGEGVRRLQVRAAGGALPFGTLLVQLPSDTTGGAVRVQRGTETKVYRFESSTAETYSFVSYYAGCSEARDTVTSGWRLCLEYDLVRATPGPLPTLFDPSHIIRTVAQAVEMWSRDPAGPAKLGCVEPPTHPHPARHHGDQTLTVCAWLPLRQQMASSFADTAAMWQSCGRPCCTVCSAAVIRLTPSRKPPQRARLLCVSACLCAWLSRYKLEGYGSRPLFSSLGGTCDPRHPSACNGARSTTLGVLVDVTNTPTRAWWARVQAHTV